MQGNAYICVRRDYFLLVFSSILYIIYVKNLYTIFFTIFQKGIVLRLWHCENLKTKFDVPSQLYLHVSGLCEETRAATHKCTHTDMRRTFRLHTGRTHTCPPSCCEDLVLVLLTVTLQTTMKVTGCEIFRTRLWYLLWLQRRFRTWPRYWWLPDPFCWTGYTLKWCWARMSSFLLGQKVWTPNVIVVEYSWGTW